MNYLVVIPARDGSKGLPGKNIKKIAGKPLINYTVDVARKIFKDQQIIVSTDGESIKSIVEKTGLNVPFLRPVELAMDNSTTKEVVLHALNFYQNKIQHNIDAIVLLQPTSPLREEEDIKQALEIFEQNYDELDMVVSVKKTDANPYYVLYENGEDDFLLKSKKGSFTRRQDCPDVYEINGAIYIYKTTSFIHKSFDDFKIKKSLMTKVNSVDIDDIIDFKLAELILKEKI